MNRSYRNLIAIILLLALIYMISGYFSDRLATADDAYTSTQFYKDLKEGKLESVRISQNEEVPTGSVTVVLKGKDKHYKTFYVSDVNLLIERIEEEGGPYALTDVKHSSNLLNNVIPICLGMILVMIFMTMLLNRSMGGEGNRMSNFGKSKAQMIEPSTMKIGFDQVAGLQEEKEELEEIVDFLKNPGKYISLGARIPKGIILVGPPGTGKTLLAKAVSGEAGVPFFSISGSDFVEMFVGVGASRVRDLFEQAKKNSPCIVFIDEIDAVARRRGSGLGGGHDEREQTLNQLLVEMDGFGVNEGIIVMAATNRVDILDPAILRPGRFDRKVAVGRPDVKGREEILKVHSRGKKLDESVDLHQIAVTTPGFSGADLENLINEAAINAAKDNSSFIRMGDIQKAFIKVGVGTEKKSRLIPEKERRITAYHEAGHAILFHYLPDVGPVYTISIIPTGIGAAGYTMPLPENDNVFDTRNTMLQDIKVGMGGRIAEELIFGDITTGAAQDIKGVTGTARAMVTKYGMSDKLGFLNYEQDSDEVFLGKDLGHARTYGEDVARMIDEEVKRIVDECYVEAKSLIREHIDLLHSCAALLLEKEKVTREEFEALIREKEKETGKHDPVKTDGEA